MTLKYRFWFKSVKAKINLKFRLYIWAFQALKPPVLAGWDISWGHILSETNMKSPNQKTTRNTTMALGRYRRIWRTNWEINPKMKWGCDIKVHIYKHCKVPFPTMEDWKINFLVKAESYWYTDDPKTKVAVIAGKWGQQSNIMLLVSLSKDITVFQAEVAAIHLCDKERRQTGKNSL